MFTVKDLYDKLQRSGTGERKLTAIAECTSVEQAIEVLTQFPGTHAKALAFVAEAAAKAAPVVPAHVEVPAPVEAVPDPDPIPATDRPRGRRR